MLSYNPPNLWNYGSKLDIDSLVNTAASKLSTLTIANNGFISTPTINTLNISSLSSINGYDVSTIFSAILFDKPVTERTTGISPILITATTSGTANILGSATLTTTFIAAIDINALVTLQINVSTHTNISVFVTLTPPGGVEAVAGNIYTATLNGNNHFITIPVLATALNIAPGDSVVRFKAFSNIGSVFTATSRQLSAIGNLIKG